ncbi:MAG: bile acid:sodium symporter [Planctomycetota bacterium]
MIGRLCQRHWFLLGLIAVVVVAWWWPALASDIIPLSDAKLALVALAFTAIGCQVDPLSLVRALRHWRLHLLVQGVSLVLCPLSAWLMLPLLRQWFGPELALGLFALAAMPTTVTSCVVLVVNADGDRPSAVCSATLGNLLGIMITPLWLAAADTSLIGGSVGTVAVRLSMSVVVPLIVGMSISRLAPLWTANHRQALSRTAQIILLLIVLAGLSGAFAVSGQPAINGTLLLALSLGLAIHPALLTAVWYMSAWRWWRCDHGQRISATLCASHKTMALGLPLLGLLLRGDPRLGLICLPLIAYHPWQLIIDSIIVRRWHEQSRA